MVWVIIIILLLLIYGVFIEPHFMKVRNIKHESNQGIKIAHFSDTHFTWHTSYRRFIKFAKNIEKNKPELIVFTGDLFDQVEWAKKRNWSNLINLFSNLQAPMGKIAILGNHDFDENNHSSFVEEVLKKSGFEILRNKSLDLKSFSIAGLDDLREGNPDFNISIKKSAFSLLMIHESDTILNVKNLEQFDLVLAGHSHGGQIRLGNLRLRNNGSKYFDSGLYSISNKTILYVNNGIGLTFLPIRLGVPPEIVYYEI